MKKIAITTTSFAKHDDRPLRLLGSKGFEIRLNPYGRKLEEIETIELCKDAIGIIAGTEAFNGATLEKFVNLKAISRCGSGLDNIDLTVAKRLGIKVSNTPDAATLAVAELTIGLILNLLRKVNEMDISTKNGRWEKLMGSLLNGKKVGVIGFGRIGKKVAALLVQFGCAIKYYDIRTGNPALRFNRADLDELLKTSDIITIHVSSKEQIIGENEFGMMKKGAWIVNTSRGGVVNEKALFQVLKIGRLSGAALDVFEKDPYSGPLKDLSNVILTPHIGSYAKESRVEMEMQAAQNLLKDLK